MSSTWIVQRKVTDFVAQCDQEGRDWQRLRTAGSRPATQRCSLGSGAATGFAKLDESLRRVLDQVPDTMCLGAKLDHIGGWMD
eukprot:gene40329-51780_t